MSVLDILAGLFQKEATNLTAGFVPADHITPPLADSAPLNAGDAYFRLWVSRMFLRLERNWFQDFFPVVQGVSTFAFGDKQESTVIAKVAGPDALREVDPDHLNRVIALELPLTPLVPFNGGTVQIEAGLVAMPTGDPITERFLKAMSNFSNLVAVPQLSTVLNLADAVNKGVEDLFAPTKKQLVLGYQQAFVSAGGGGANELRPGYVALINGSNSSFPLADLWVQDGTLGLGPEPSLVEPITSADYMLLRIETRKNRDDWQALSAINDPFRMAMDALDDVDDAGNPRVASGDAYIRAAVVAVRHSPDLTETDRNQLMRSLRDTYKQARDEAMSGAKDLGAKQPTLDDVARNARNLDAAPVTFEELFG